MAYVFSDIVDVPNITPADDADEIGGQDQIVYPLIIQPTSSNWRNYWSAVILVNGTTVYTASKAGGVGYRSFRLSLYTNPVPISGPAIDWAVDTVYSHKITISVLCYTPPAIPDRYCTGQPYIGGTLEFETDRAPTAPSNIYPVTGAINVEPESPTNITYTWDVDADATIAGIRRRTTSFTPANDTYSYDQLESYNDVGLAVSTTYFWAIHVERNKWDNYSSIMSFTTAATLPASGVPYNLGNYHIEHRSADGALENADLTLDGVFVAKDVSSDNIAPNNNQTYTYQWDDEDEREVRVVSGVADRPMKHQISGKQRAGDTIWHP